MKRTSCSACGCTQLDQFLDLGHSPIADAYTATKGEVSPAYPLQVAVCAKCRLVQLLEVIDDLFGTGYSFYSSASAPLSAYHKAYATDVLTKHGQVGKRGVVEVGCNDGDLLRHFVDYPCIGVDPALGPATVARERGLEVEVRPFGLAAAHEIRDRRGKQGLVIANHVLAHVADVADVLFGIAALMDNDSVAMVEVQYLPDLLVNNAFDLVYHEHRNFFSLTSLGQAAIRQGLYVIDAELTDRQGGSLRATLSKDGRTWSERMAALMASESWLDSFGAYEGMQGRVERIRDRLLDVLAKQKDPIAAYGAPAKLTTLLHFCGLGVGTIKWCVDTTVAKQGRYIPGTGIPIVVPKFVYPNAYLLAAWNYAGPIIRQEREFTGDWIIPIPAPVVI